MYKLEFFHWSSPILNSSNVIYETANTPQTTFLLIHNGQPIPLNFVGRGGNREREISEAVKMDSASRVIKYEVVTLISRAEERRLRNRKLIKSPFTPRLRKKKTFVTLYNGLRRKTIRTEINTMATGHHSEHAASHQ